MRHVGVLFRKVPRGVVHISEGAMIRDDGARFYFALCREDRADVMPGDELFRSRGALVLCMTCERSAKAIAKAIGWRAP